MLIAHVLRDKGSAVFTLMADVTLEAGFIDLERMPVEQREMTTAAFRRGGGAVRRHTIYRGAVRANDVRGFRHGTSSISLGGVIRHIRSSVAS